MLRVKYLILGIVLLPACERSQPPREAPPAPQIAAPPVESPSPAVASPSATPAPPALFPGASAQVTKRTIEIDGLRLAYLSDGKVHLKGTDVWKQPIDVVYESEEYFRKAVPVLTRGLTPAQATGLERAAGITPTKPTEAVRPSLKGGK